MKFLFSQGFVAASNIRLYLIIVGNQPNAKPYNHGSNFSSTYRRISIAFSQSGIDFSLVLAIILLAPLLLQRIKIPGIIGLIISGIIIGPDGFNILEQNEFVDIFSTIGLLYIMFIAGLELDLNQFKTHRNKSIVFGIYTFIIPLGIGFPLCYYVLSMWDSNFDFAASLLVASMFATHTLLTYPLVSKLGISKDKAVAITVGGTILTDTAVLILLAIILGSHTGGLTQEFWIRLIISFILYSLIMFILFPWLQNGFSENWKVKNIRTTSSCYPLCFSLLSWQKLPAWNRLSEHLPPDWH